MDIIIIPKLSLVTLIFKSCRRACIPVGINNHPYWYFDQQGKLLCLRMEIVDSNYDQLCHYKLPQQTLTANGDHIIMVVPSSCPYVPSYDSHSARTSNDKLIILTLTSLSEFQIVLSINKFF